MANTQQNRPMGPQQNESSKQANPGKSAEDLQMNKNKNQNQNQDQKKRETYEDEENESSSSGSKDRADKSQSTKKE